MNVTLDKSQYEKSVLEQGRETFAQQMQENIAIAKANLEAPRFKGETDFDEAVYSTAHLNDKASYEPPEPALVAHYFRQLKQFDRRFTDKVIAWEIFGMTSESADRAIRRYRNGARNRLRSLAKVSDGNRSKGANLAKGACSFSIDATIE